MDIDLICCSVGACFVALCVETPGLLLKASSLSVLIVSVVYLKFISVKGKKHAVPVRKCVLSGKYPPPNLPAITSPVVTTKVDSLITEVISLSLRDFVFSWFSPPLVSKTQKVSDIATTLSWQLVYLTQNKLNEMDIVTLLFQDIMIKVHSHFKKVREKDFEFKDYLSTEEDVGECCESLITCSHGNEEKAFLKRAGIITLITMTPRSIWLSPLFTELLGDILSSYVLYPLVKKIVEPDYLYQCILPFIDTIGSPMKKQRFFTQAKTYEDFIKKINRETDLNKLRQLRYKVIAEIMQSMTIENLKQEEDVDGLLSQIDSKSYRLSTRNLARYINQCKVAKMTCEKRIHDVTKIQKRKPHYADMRFKESETKLLELDEILYSPYVLPFFVQYLEKQEDYGPLKLWLIIEQCRVLECKPEEMYPLIKQGYLDHLTVTSPLRAHQVSRHLVRMAEAYVEHKSGYWQFIYELQDEIYTMLLEQHYKPFLISSQYMQYVCSTEGRRCKSPLLNEYPPLPPDSLQSSGTTDTYPDTKMNILKEELKSKQVLLDTLDVMNYCSEEELIQLQEEITNLRVTINQLEHHSERADLWWKYLGCWRVFVDSVTASPDPLYTIMVKRQRDPSQEILHFSSESQIKLTQFNLKSNHETSPRRTRRGMCVCAHQLKGFEEKVVLEESEMTREFRSESAISRDDDNNDNEGEVEIDVVSNRMTDSDHMILRRDSQTPSYVDEADFPQSYLSLAPHSLMIARAACYDDTSVSTLMFTPEQDRSLCPLVESTSRESQDSESGSTGFCPQFSNQSSPYTSLEFSSQSHKQPGPPSLCSESHPQSSDLITSLRHQSESLYPKLEGTDDEDTISACSQDFPPNFMFDDIFNQRDSITSSVTSSDSGPPEDTSSLKVRRYLAEYTTETDSNQCDDEKLRALSEVSSTLDSSTSSCVLIDAASTDEEDDRDPYLVVDVQSMPNDVAAPQLLEGAADAQPERVCTVCKGELVVESEEIEEDGGVGGEEEDSSTQTGWIVTRTWEQVKQMYISLRGCKSTGYPPSFPVPPPKDDAQMSASKEHVADFLNFLLRDKTLSQSEQVYRFFNPTCDLLYRPSTSKTGLGEVREDKHKDSIAIPFYTLLGEIFEIHGHLQWLRRQIIYLVRITFGSTIERQIYRALSWTGSEQQLIWYTQCLKTSLWGHAPPPSEGGREERRKRVRGCLLNTPPHLLVVLFGASKTKKGLTKLLDTMENPQYGKQLIYTSIELIVLHFIGNQIEPTGTAVK